MKRYPRSPNTEIKSQGVGADTDVSSDQFDVATELELCEEILRREIRNLMSESARGKLSKDAAASLRDYIKLLSDMREEQQETLKHKTKEELEKLAKD